MYKPLQIAITSLLQHNTIEHLYVLALENELPFPVPCPHTVINVSGQTYFPPGCPNVSNRFTVMSPIRVCIPDLIAKPKAIVLDVDLVVCDTLQPLWDIDITGKWLAWCPEYKATWNPFGHAHYYNMGVVVMNLDQMRRDHAVTIMVNELNNNRFEYAEQDCFNKIAVPDLTTDIPVRFNESFCCGYTDRPAIVHFAGYMDFLTNPARFRWEYIRPYL